ncbi:MAG: RNA polymerase sigma factor [Acidiferrobacterales bacterium]|nr:RNA polymerase sigma factor [Acidiferrobacterales bacterium]
MLRPHLDSLFRLAFRFTGAEDRAEDLVQDVLIKLFPKVEQLREVDNLRPWLARVLYRHFINDTKKYLRSRVKLAADLNSINGLEDDPLENPVDTTPGPVELLEFEQGQAELLAAWEQLSPDHRTVLALHDVEEYTAQEVGEMLDCPVGTIKSRLHRARERLKELLLMEPFDAESCVRSQKDIVR